MTTRRAERERVRGVVESEEREREREREKVRVTKGAKMVVKTEKQLERDGKKLRER